MLINRLLMACGRCHFEARQRLEAPEFWHHLNTAVWLEVWRAHTKACKQVWAKNFSRTKQNYLVKIMSWMTYWARSNLRRGKWFEMAAILMLKSTYNLCQSRQGSYDFRAFQFSPCHFRIRLPVALQ